MASDIRGPFILVDGPNRYDLLLKSFLYGEYVLFDLDPKGEATAHGAHAIGVRVQGIWWPIAENDFGGGGDHFHFFGTVEMGALGRYCRGFFDARSRKGVVFCGDHESHKEIARFDVPWELMYAVYLSPPNLTNLRRAVTLYRRKQSPPQGVTAS